MSKTKYAKSLAFNMTEDVVKCVEQIMVDEGQKTMTGAITACILDRKRLREALREEESASNKLFHQKLAIEAEVTKFAQFQEYVRKHTKSS